MSRFDAERWIYRKAVRPVLFGIDPEVIHDRMTDVAEFFGRTAPTRALTRAFFRYDNPALRQTIAGVDFTNPVGLSAGFDKNARLTQVMADIGFGFEEIGSMSIRPCAGNPKPRLQRLPESKSVLVNYGLMNDGAEVIAARLSKARSGLPLGISLVPTNDAGATTIPAMVEEVAAAHRILAPHAAYITLNLSCPNACQPQPFMSPVALRELLPEIVKLPNQRPIFLKISPDVPFGQLDELMAVAAEHKVTGFIATNLTKQREGNSALHNTDLPEKGGLSGKVVSELADRSLEHLARQSAGRFVLMGVGGIFSAEDAYRKIGLGASLLQLITGMLYEGPGLIGSINHGLVERLVRDGFKNISDAVGKDL
jgi:dihydroorotate dehydrogenase subfamily 2